jgi:hypothetical protein
MFCKLQLASFVPVLVAIKNSRTGVVAGSPVSEELMNSIEDRLGIKELTILYGRDIRLHNV